MSKKSLEPKALFDVRVISHQMRRGEMNVKAVQKYLDSLPDDADEASETETRFTTPWAERHYESNDT